MQWDKSRVISTTRHIYQAMQTFSTRSLLPLPPASSLSLFIFFHFPFSI